MSRQAGLESELIAAVEAFLDDGLEPPSIEACKDLGFALSAVVDSVLRADAGWVQEGMGQDGFSLAIALRDGNQVRVSGTLHEVSGGERVLVADLSRSGTVAIWNQLQSPGPAKPQIRMRSHTGLTTSAGHSTSGLLSTPGDDRAPERCLGNKPRLDGL